MNPLAHLFSSEVLAEILCLFFLNPREEFYQSRIVKETGKGLIQVQRSLKRLEKTGLISSERKGRMVYYKSEPSHPAFEDLKRAFLKTLAFGTPLRSSLGANEKIELACIFGSVAQGMENKESDIDILIVSDLNLEQLSKMIGPLSRKINRELNAVFLTQKDFLKKNFSNDYFIREIVEKPKIWLIGNDQELARLLERSIPENTSSFKK